MNTCTPEHWHTTAEHFKKVTDGIGMHIDEGIFDLVVTLNALGINTRQSCEGHLDRALPYPWIDIEKTSGCEQQEKEWESAKQKLKEAKKKKENEELDPYYDEFHRARDALVDCRLEEPQQLYVLLNEFYASHQIQYDSILIIEEWANGLGRLYPHDGIFQGRRNDRERKEHLEQYQHEMNDFTDFLKTTYCGF